MTPLLTIINVLVSFVFLYTAASAAVYGIAEMIQLILHKTSPAGAPYSSAGPPTLDRSDTLRLVTPPLVTGGWLALAWFFGLGMAT